MIFVKKLLSLLLCVLLVGLLAFGVMAAPEEPVIIMQPQSPNYPEYSVAYYTVKVSGTNLRATWYLEWEGKTYNVSDYTNAMEPWEAYAGENYGPVQEDANTFSCFFAGIEHPLNGATLWCEIEDGHYLVTSQKAYINLGNPATPPTILEFPAQITVEQGAAAEIRCVARSNDETQLGYIWYETATGKLENIQAMDRGTEVGDCLQCDTSQLGTRYYVCAVKTSAGGICYSSVVPVTVTPKTAEEPKILTDTLPEGTAGQPYNAKLACSDPEAEFSVYYNPGKANDFEKTGLSLAKDGTLSGTPTAAGSYGFCICAAGAGGEDYMVYTLNVREAEQETTEATETTDATDATVPPTTEETPVATAPTETVPQPTEQQDPDTEPAGLPWWMLVLTGVVAATVGVAVALLLVRKKPGK